MITKSVKHKIILPVVVVLAMLVLVMTVYFSYDFAKYTDILFKERIKIIAVNLSRYLEDCERNSKIAAISTAKDLSVIKAVSERDANKILEILTDALGLYAVDFFTVTDETGTVLTRTHALANFGDSVLAQENIQDALKGDVRTYVEQGTIVMISVRTGAPVFDGNGRLVGVISAGVRLDTNEAVDSLKRQFDAEFTAFLGNTRIATTVELGGKRIVNTQLNPDVAKIVLEDGNEYFGDVDILGEDYSAYYMPLKNAQGEVFAILFSGQSNMKLITERNRLIKNGIIIGLLGLIISIIMLLGILVRIVKPIKHAAHIVSEVTRGNVNVDIVRSNVIKDEIAALTHDIYSLIDVIKSMTSDLSQLTHDLNIYGDINYLIDTNKYRGSHKKIIDGIKTLSDSISMMKKTMAVIDYLDTMITVVDFDYNLLYANRSLAEKFGIDRESCLNQKCYKVIRKLDKPCPVCQMSKCLSDNDSFPVVAFHNEWDDCTEMWIGGRAAAIKWVDGSKVFLNSFYDETQKKNYEVELNKAINRAEEASVAKSTFLANMSHEIRTPMNSIIGFSELAMSLDISPKTKEYLTNISENAKWLLQIINDILDISKIESGKMELEKIPFDLHKLVDNCKNTIMPRAIKKNIGLAFYTEPSIDKMLSGDPTRLRQVLINLLFNAVKFTDAGKVSLSISVINSSESAITLLFEINDTGIGMTPDQITKIFEPFAQADVSTTRKYGGTGLGLTITKNILELMDSRLEVESTLGVGSKICFLLKFDTVDATYKTPETKDIVNELTKPLFKGVVLVCEDNQMNQSVIIEHLARVGLDAEIAENGQEGIEKVKKRIEKGEKPFDLIFMDINMPVMDGIEATPKIIELGSGAPVIAMTANIMTGDSDLYRTLGMKCYIGKPFTSQELWRCLLKFLKPLSKTSAKAGGSEDAEDEDVDITLKNQLIADFVKSNRAKFDEITQAVNGGDIKLAQRLAHNLKSNAGLLGKTALQKAAEDVENSLMSGQIPLPEAQTRFLQFELDSVLGELKSYIDEITVPVQTETKTAVVDGEKAREIFERLEPLLRSGTPECLKLIDDLRAIPGSAKLIEQMEDFYFRQALKTLAELKETL